MVGIVGEPGVGKSRLLAEFLRTHQHTGGRLLETRSAAYSQATPYQLIIDLLRSDVGLEERDDGPLVREKVTRLLARLDLPHNPLLAPLMTLLGRSLDDPTWQALASALRRERTLEAIRQVLLRESQMWPLLLVVEDLHWSDHETQAVFDCQVDSVTRASLLVLNRTTRH